MPYDLLIKGGHLLDPGSGINGVMDVGITDGKIAAVEADISTQRRRRGRSDQGSASLRDAGAHRPPHALQFRHADAGGELDGGASRSSPASTPA